MNKILVIALLAIIALLVITNAPKVDKPTNVVKVEGKKYEVVKEIHDTLKVTIEKKGKSIPQEKIVIHDTIPQKVDTSAILEDYYTKKYYQDTLTLDSAGYLVLFDSIYKNKIISRYYMSHIVEKTITSTMIVKPLPTWHLYGGFDVSLDQINLINMVGGNVILQTKNNRMYGFGAGVTSKVTPYVSFQYYFKIK